MKAIVTETKEGEKSYLLFDSIEIYEKFSKICMNFNMNFIGSEEEFDELKNINVPIGEYRPFKGCGIYDNNAEKHNFIIDKEDGLKYSIIEEFSQVEHGEIKLIPNTKIITPNFLNLMN